MELIFEAGLVDGKFEKSLNSSSYYVINRLTWNGHEFLDSINNDNIWKKTKNSFISNGISMIFDLVETTAKKFIESAISS